jgi:hypothetical protein
MIMLTLPHNTPHVELADRAGDGLAANIVG